MTLPTNPEGAKLVADGRLDADLLDTLSGYMSERNMDMSLPAGSLDPAEAAKTMRALCDALTALLAVGGDRDTEIGKRLRAMLAEGFGCNISPDHTASDVMGMLESVHADNFEGG